VVVGKHKSELGSLKEETEDRRHRDEGAVLDSDGDEENRAPELNILPVRLLFLRCIYF
jgi:hypothetical protein